MEEKERTIEQLFNLGFHAEYPEEKVEYYSAILESDSRDPLLWKEEALALVWTNTGIAYCDLSEYQKAVYCFEKALELDSLNPDIWYNKGIAHSYLGNHRESVKSYTKALEVDPKYDNAWINKGMLHDILGEYEEAIKCYEHVHVTMEIDPKYALAWNKKGIAYYHLRKYAEAITCFTKVLNMDPDYEDAKNNMANAMKKLKSAGEQ
ncbi:TPR repeat-containing protein [Methanococcoides vulcani]|uniref:TPR repeat-containing protein n=1 Tax=Methanococcoides vulcani TaxID=1353158 RepID=A0A1I0BS66_9EURY|nr:tetratricopeptide repeat protein [Methanococcoides vulcani]SET09462.1 TPR repeat-containing protein [Methanococcoides vulcani]